MSGWKWYSEIKDDPLPFPCCSVICQCHWKKTLIEKKNPCDFSKKKLILSKNMLGLSLLIKIHICLLSTKTKQQCPAPVSQILFLYFFERALIIIELIDKVPSRISNAKNLFFRKNKHPWKWEAFLLLIYAIFTE